MGYVAGNPVTDSQFDEDGKIPCLHGMGLISNELYECTKDINMLHVLEPLCEEVWSPRIHNTSATDGMSRLMLESARAADDDIIEFKCRKASYVVLKIWANDKTVRESLGVHKGTVGKWTRCNYDIDYIKDVYSTVEYHLTLMRKGYRALIYSGDHDCGIPFTSTQAWIRFLNLSVVDDWRPWYVAGQVAGFTRSHANNNLIYATVKGAGHTAPEYKPKECLEIASPSPIAPSAVARRAVAELRRTASAPPRAATPPGAPDEVSNTQVENPKPALARGSAPRRRDAGRYFFIASTVSGEP
uniref:Uncharacterized protein n=2 Tax=Oryza meridionalis TaxID=40149 RepID=A0A0E0F5H3_9ORYZ